MEGKVRGGRAVGPAGLEDRPLGRPTGSRVSEATKRAILLLKEWHPDWKTVHQSATPTVSPHAWTMIVDPGTGFSLV